MLQCQIFPCFQEATEPAKFPVLCAAHRAVDTRASFFSPLLMWMAAWLVARQRYSQIDQRLACDLGWEHSVHTFTELTIRELRDLLLDEAGDFFHMVVSGAHRPDFPTHEIEWINKFLRQPTPSQTQYLVHLARMCATSVPQSVALFNLKLEPGRRGGGWVQFFWPKARVERVLSLLTSYQIERQARLVVQQPWATVFQPVPVSRRLPDK